MKYITFYKRYFVSKGPSILIYGMPQRTVGVQGPENEKRSFRDYSQKTAYTIAKP